LRWDAIGGMDGDRANTSIEESHHCAMPEGRPLRAEPTHRPPTGTDRRGTAKPARASFASAELAPWRLTRSARRRRTRNSGHGKQSNVASRGGTSTGTVSGG
jgi:hypothetical protein